MSSKPINADLIILLAITSVVITVAIIVLFVVFISKKNAILKSRLEAKLQMEREMHQLELQALRSQMNPHFVHNSLNAIQYYIQRNEVELSEEYLNRFSKLFRSFFELSRKDTISLKEEYNLLENYLAIEKMRFEDKLTYKLSVDKKLDCDLPIPSLLLQPIVENAINHGIFHKSETGLVHILFKQLSEQSYKVIIEDDGIGLKKSKALFEKSNKTITHRSSTVLKDRLKLLESSELFQVDYKIKERKKVGGTRVILIFKILN